MDELTVRARAKINLTLDILGKRADGYHELSTVMQTLRLHDTVSIKKVGKYAFKFVTDHPRLPLDGRNLVCMAAQYLIQTYGIAEGVFISLKKVIPVSAGLAGGSSDCAAVLLGMNRLFGLGIPYGRLLAIGGRFGADVPFCMLQGTALAEGVGERLTGLPPHPAVWVLLAKPPVRVSTQAVFERYDDDIGNDSENKGCDIEAIKKALGENNAEAVAKCFRNALTHVTAKMHPKITDLIDLMRRSGAYNASMSGSGPTVFGYFPDKQSAQLSKESIKKQFPRLREIMVTTIYNPSRPNKTLVKE